MAKNRSLNNIFILSLVLLIMGCGGVKKVSIQYAKAPEKTLKKFEVKPSKVELKSYKTKKELSVAERVNNYVATFSHVAREEMKMYDMPAGITLAQGILESGIGDIRLALEANKHCGMKCHGEWGGESS